MSNPPPPATALPTLPPQKPFDWFDSHGRVLNPAKGHDYLEISMTPTGVNVKQEPVSDLEVPAFSERLVNTPSDATWRLHVLITLFEGWEWEHPYSNATIDALQKHWHIGRSCFNSASHRAMTATFESPNGDLTRKGLRLGSLRTLRATLALSHSPSTRQTFAIVYSTSTYTMNRIFSALLASKEHAYQPHLLPFIYTAQHLQCLEDFFRGLPAGEYYSIMRTLGADSYHEREERPTPPDLTDMPRTLTALTRMTADVASVKETIGQQIELVTKWAEEFPKLEDGKEDVAMRERLRLMGQYCEQVGLDVREMSETIQAMVQMVYAILQQRDNELNRRYAADMRVITAITLVFLPGTFVATLFSASFWNFDPRSGGKMVSSWVWLYFVSTAVLTLVVLAVWRGFAALKQTMGAVKRFWRVRVLRRKEEGDGDEENATAAAEKEKEGKGD
ncbi:hypothetical protein CC86DRAFT_456555 [Ophiobolus disseminans]|uniref:Cora-domain-containing protein n=1 Tax=Ophiobolus disseminans TaxID=1469910 RepID=A0A6A6ZY80_9PLEO|nr:hypothetical protein CC86DRAFT_456555 [Ophiobolus disseminans]